MKQKKTGKKRKLEEVKERKMTKPNEDTVYLKRDIMEALKRSDEKNGKVLKKDRRKMENFSRKVDDMLEKFLNPRNELIHRENERRRG